MMTEAQEQSLLMDWAKKAECTHPELKLMFHIPNGGKRDAITGKHLKEQGAKAGVPDLFLPVARGIYHGLFIEMKRAKGGVLSQFQREYITALIDQGYRVAVCHGFDEAKRTIEEYLNENVSDG